ncbi:MAG TPA: tetratricopeptide repeat protein, partial [Candidatus Lokiarchaeia archaeon]|nr:tetratricopeptide repeat protein [Candidatus Lokiarchaeia archaeon]
SMGNYAEAGLIYSQIVDIAEDVFGPVSDEVAKASNDLGLVYLYEGNYETALPLFDRALDILESSEELDLCIANPELPGSILNNKALVYIEQGLLEAAIAILQQALHFDEKTLGEDHPAVARDLTHLAEAYKRQEEFGQADAASRWATAVSQENKDRKSYFQTHKIDAEL